MARRERVEQRHGCTTIEETRAQPADYEPLARGLPIDDEVFDRIYPAPIRAISRRFWTPVKVAVRALELLDPSPSTRVLDVGAGVGKFCVVGALATAATFVGVEHRQGLIDIGRRTLQRLDVRRASMMLGVLEMAPWNDFDAFYLFNPFEENLNEPAECIDSSIPLSQERYCRDVRLFETVLKRARVGTRVAIYQGFGGRVPGSYRLCADETIDDRSLQLWMKTELASRPTLPMAARGSTATADATRQTRSGPWRDGAARSAG
jgi:hypothetical protein